MEKPVRSSFQYLSISYECALAIGNSLNLSEMLHKVIHTIVHKTNAHRGVIWVKNGEQEFQPVANAGINIKDVLARGEIKDLRDVLNQIQKRQKFVLRYKDEKDFLEYCPVLTGKEEAALIVPVTNVAIIHLVYASREIADEPLANLLASLSKKLSVAIEACMAHEKIIKEIQVREKAENELTKKTEQLISGEKKIQRLYERSEQARKSLLSILEDVTQKEEALRESETRFRKLLENIPTVAVQGYTADGIIHYWNKANELIYGYTAEEAIGKNLVDLIIPSEMREDVQKLIKHGAKTGEMPPAAELTLMCKDGNPVTVFTSHAVVQQSGKEPELFCIDVDLTERKQAEEALRESENKYRSLFESSRDAIMLLTAKGKYFSGNPAAHEIFGFKDEDEFIFQTPSDLSPQYQPDGSLSAEKAQMIIEEVIKKGSRFFEWTHKRTNGEEFFASVLLTRMELEGRVVLQATVRDITERVRAQESLKQSTDELTRLYRASGVLLASASPDLGSLAQTIVETILLEFEHTNCSLILVRPGSQELKRLAVAGPYANEVSKGKLRLDGSGLVPQAIRSGEIVNLPDVTVSPDYVPNWDAARSELAVPLKIDQRVIGVIDMQSAKPGDFNTNDERLMFTFAERAALALENARLFSEANRRLKRLGALHAIDKAISASLDINLTTGIFLEQTLTQLEVDAADVLLFDPFLQTLECIGRKGFRTSALEHTHLRLGQGLAGQVALGQEIKFIPDLQEEGEVLLASPDLSREEFVSYYGIPLVAKGTLKGVLEIFHRAPLSADNEWLTFLNTLARQAAIAIDNASMFTDLQRSNLALGMAYDSTLEGWAKALELKDMETEGHSRRVTEMTMGLAKAMGIGGDALAHVYRGALLHDIGKMGIPDSILQKPGPLTDEEWQIMRKHPGYAFEWLSSIEYLRPALDIPYSHHEKWDGSGYPQGLRGEQIPLAARIFAIVDVWDALRSDRPYRDAWEAERVIEYLREQSGTHFDPQVVVDFLKLIPKAG